MAGERDVDERVRQSLLVAAVIDVEEKGSRV